MARNGMMPIVTRMSSIRWLALGATPMRISRIVLGQASWITGIGLVLGLAGAYALTRLVESQLYGVERTDPGSYAAAAVFFVVVTLVASWKPLRSAFRVDPANTLREG
jgi:putative ABC transport system permease protein